MTEVLLNYWPQLVALAGVVIWTSREIARLNEKIDQAEKKITTLFDRWNSFQDKIISKWLDHK